MKKTIFIVSIALAALSLTATGCSTMGTLTFSASQPRSANKPKAKPAPSHRSIGHLRNNSTLRLEAGTYRGGLTIRENSVTIAGAGSARTVIVGNMTITGNNCVLRDVRIQGDVRLSGNNADLRSAVIEGRVTSTGQNNRW